MAVKDDILQKALDLPPGDRAELAHKLLESVEGVDEDEDAAEPVSAEEEKLGDELLRRLDDLRSGRVKGVTQEEFRRHMKALRERHVRKLARRSRSSSTRRRSKK